MAGLVLEGGSLRGIFSAGAMDALLDSGIYFDYVIGVSAGITNGVSYISRQKGRNIEVLQKYRNDKRYISKRNVFRYGSLFGMDFLFDEIPNTLVPFDWNRYYNFEGTIRIGLTDALTGEAVYKDGKSVDRKCNLIRATCAIPLVVPPIKVNGREYFDGGLSDSIPIKKSIFDGNKKNLVILTQPKGFVKEQSKSAILASLLYKQRYPKLIEAIKNRPKMYNDTIDYLNNLEKEQPNDIVIIRPKYKLGSFEADIKVLEKTYKHGYDVAMENIDKIVSLFTK